MRTGPPTIPEIITVELARSLHDHEVGFTGLVTGEAATLYGTCIPLAAMALAKLMHAPNLTILLAGWSHNPDLSMLEIVPDSEYDAVLRDLPCDAQSIRYPGCFSFKRGDVDFGFSSGVQLDRSGCLNSVCIGDYKRPTVRLVGPILLPEHMTIFGREYIMMPYHTKRVFVEKVDFVSGVGYPGGLAGRSALGLDRGGPEWVMTPECIFDFDKAAGNIRLRSIHRAEARSTLRDKTGFDLLNIVDAPVTPIPTRDELDLLRHRVDPRGILLGFGG